MIIDIEIISVNDCSEDNSLQVLKKLAKKDSRIKIINNDRNRGLLYSRAMGILNSKGEYIMNLDPDDELKGRYNLEYLYKIINRLKIDVINFGVIKKYGFSSSKLILCSNFTNIKFQPEIFNSNSENFDFLIFNKLVKNKIFKKAFMIFKDKINGGKWNFGEDEIWSILINKYATTKICVEKAIYIYHINDNSLTSYSNTNLYLINLINWIEMIKKISINKNKNIYLNRFELFLKLIEINKIFLLIIKNNSEIRNKFFKIFKNNSFQFKINNSTLKNIIATLKNKIININVD